MLLFQKQEHISIEFSTDVHIIPTPKKEFRLKIFCRYKIHLSSETTKLNVWGSGLSTKILFIYAHEWLQN